MKSGTSRREPITERGRGRGSSSLKYAVGPLRTPPASQSPREESKLESQRVFFPFTWVGLGHSCRPVGRFCGAFRR